ncbi:MAG: ABC transporter permease [Desulfobulbaceae bacterium]|jgi:NitT/TauT family transport system permease protein|nr:ABC transporter permease [Desulfobulbaceae bacterium]
MNGKQLLFLAVSLPIFLLAWEVVCRLFAVPSYLIPSPGEIFTATYQVKDELFVHTGVTFLEAFLGFGLGSLFGVTLGVLCSFSKNIETMLMPYAIALKTIPIVAIAPLLTIWFGTNFFPKILLAALTCFFPTLINTIEGLKSVPQDYIDVFNSMASSEWQIFRWLRWPNALPYIFSGLKIATVFAVIGAIVAEFAGAMSGIGFRLLIASYQLETAVLFVYIIASSILGICCYGVVCLVGRLIITWEK